MNVIPTHVKMEGSALTVRGRSRAVVQVDGKGRPVIRVSLVNILIRYKSTAKRNIILYHNDRKTFTHIYIYNRVALFLILIHECV